MIPALIWFCERGPAFISADQGSVEKENGRCIMELNINSPAWFKEHVGVDDEVYRFCQRAYLFFKDKEYSDTLHTIGIMPVAAPQEIYDEGAWKESVKFRCDQSVVSIVIRMDFMKYSRADCFGKVEQIRETVLEAVKRIRPKRLFDSHAFEEDFISLC